MSREIKFRGFHKHINVMEYYDTVAFLNFEEDVLCYQKSPENEPHGFSDMSGIELMQFTGLKDKNGEDIYEGDILTTDLSRHFLVVEFRSGAFMFRRHENDGYYYDFMTRTDENSNFTKYHEVIGNVWEGVE